MERGQIYLANLKQAHGNIQAGVRPVIVVQNNTGNAHAPTAIVCPTTSAFKKHLPTHFLVFSNRGGLWKNSLVLCEQIFTINKEDLIEYLGDLPKELLPKLDTCLKISLGLNKPSYSKGARYDKSNARIRKRNFR